MGDTTTTQNSTQKTTPWGAALPGLKSIISGINGINPSLTGNESGALGGLEGLAQGGNSFAPAIRGFANTMLAGGGPDRTGGVNDAYSRLQSQLGGTANGDYLDPNKNPWMSQVTSTIGDDVQNRLQGLYAGSGRDPAGAGNFGGWLGRGIAEGTAPVFGQQYQQERQNQIGAQNSLYGAGNTTGGILSNLDQTKLANEGQGINAANAATSAEADPYNRMLAAEAQRRGIPLQTLQQQYGILGPMAQQFGTTTGQSSTTTPTNWGQLATGGLIAGAGLMMGNPMPALGYGYSAMSGGNPVGSNPAGALRPIY